LALSPLPSAIRGASDGATFTLEIRDGDAVLATRTQRIPPTSPTLWGKLLWGDPHFEPFEADLSAFAGRDVTVRLRTDPAGSPDWDYVFVGAPTISGTPAAHVRRVLVVGLDTTRADRLGFHGYDRPTSP